MGFKKCPKCSNEKSVSDFHKSSATKDGLQCYCKTCRNKAKKLYRDANTGRINAQAREYRKANKGEINKRCHKYNNLDSTKERVKRWRLENADDLKKKKNEYIKERYNNNTSYRVHSCFSSLIRSSLNRRNGSKKGQKAFDIVGYSFEEYSKHLERQFDKHMSWDNYGSYWQVDHIIPRSAFMFTSYEDEGFKNCWSLRNLRPLERMKNIKKSNKIIEVS